MITHADEVRRLFCTSRATRECFEQWKDVKKAEVAPAVLGHVTRIVYELTIEDVKDVCQRTAHALGDVKREDGESVEEIVNWHPDFAFTHTLHICMEKMGHLPTYQSFRKFVLEDELGWAMLGKPSRTVMREMAQKGVPEALARAAMRWRIGNAYYSFLREVYTVVTLRGSGIDLRLHPLADALFRVDAWAGRTALSLRVANKKFSEGEAGGRKIRPESLLADLDPPLSFETIELSPATKFGRVHLPSTAELESVAALLRARM